MNYKKINNITGWVVCLIACTVYMLTKEKSASFWDCGEFLSGSFKLEVVHSPGAPLFLMLGRMFTMFTDGKGAAAAVNSLSALASGFTILFLFWSITHFAKRAFVKRGLDISGGNLIAIMGAGIVGGLAYTFSDTFWFSAVEGEVYALSSFLTALVFWAILKWEDNLNDGDARNAKFADRWIIFIFYIMGLSIGVHLLNLLAIPAIIMVYYFKKYEVTTKGTILAFIAGCVITGLVQIGIIQGIPIIASKFDVLFVNSFGLPFNSGVLFFIILFATLVVFAMRWAKKNGHYKVHLGLLSMLFIVIGFSSFLQIIIRSNADVPIDMTNPDNAISLIKYLQREQYGSVPLLFGPDFTSQPSGYEEGSMDYAKGKDNYEELGLKKDELIYDESEKRFFPRVWDRNDPRHVQYYKAYCELADGEKPSTSDNFSFFFRYQMNMMYWRYLLWNYVGRQNDIQKTMYEPDNGNWITGIPMIDNNFLGRGDQSKLPKGVKDSMANNKLYGLPFLLGLLGLFFQYRSDKRNAFVVFLLFFFTGAAIVIYLNNVPLQPRERDYAYVGSMYAFAIWIGLGVLGLYDLTRKMLGEIPGAVGSFALSLIAVPLLMASVEWDDHDRSNKTLPPDSAKNFLSCCEPNAILFTEGDNDTYPLWYLQEIEGYRTDVRVINISLLGIDWYIDQLSRKVNDAPAVPMAWKSEDYKGSKRNYAFLVGSKDLNQQPADLLTELNFVNSDANARPNNGENVNYFRSKRVSLPFGNGDSTKLIFDLPVEDGGALYKNDLGILNIVAKSIGKRPLYFANTIDPKHYEGLYPYLVQEGILFKVTNKNSGVTQPGAPTPINTAKSYDLFMNQFKFGNAHRTDVFYDQTNRRMMNIFRTAAARIADGLIAEGKKKEALDVLNHCMKGISERSYLYSVTDEDRNLMFISEAYLKAGDKKKAIEINDKLYQYLRDDIAYSKTLRGIEREQKDAELERSARLLTICPQTVQMAGDTAYAKELSAKLQELLNSGGITLRNQ
jgi:Protein of unknown function (DUF2723)